MPQISVRNISKKFCRNLRKSMFYGLVDLTKSSMGVRPGTATLRTGEFWALDDVNIEIEKGTILGIIGRNGCGKTTLLRILAGIFPPDKGEVMIMGKTATLLTIGAGFHSYMTVRENIYINGTILGMTKREINGKIDDILEFSGQKDFADAPVVTLSSGMRVRLGFSIAIVMNPDIFLIDEILAVTDGEFRKRCVRKIQHIAQNAAIVLISHDMGLISQLCTDIAVMEKGRIVYAGSDVPAGIDYYTSQMNSSPI